MELIDLALSNLIMLGLLRYFLGANYCIDYRARKTTFN